MGIHNILGVCFAVFSVSSIASANDVRVGVSPTTGYYSVTSKTFDVPKGATVSSSTAVSPTVTPLAGGGFQQSMGAGITIEGLKKPAPFTARAAASLSTMKNAAKKLAKSNPARFAAGLGLSALLDSVDWVIKGSDLIYIEEDPNPIFPDPPSTSLPGISRKPHRFATLFPTESWPFTPGTYYLVRTRYNSNNSTTSYICERNSNYFVSYQSGYCYYSDDPSLEYDFKNTEKPVSESDINSKIDSNYSPDASDFVLLTPYMPPDYILVDPIPPVVTDLGITNTFDSAGSLVGTEQTTATTEFTISNNSTSQPSISSSTSVKTETFKDGQSQGSTVTETIQPAVGGGGGGKAPTVEIPTDCDFMPTVCAFLDWFKNDDTPEDPDLSALIDNRDFTETYSITGGSKQCPADYEFTVDFIGRTYGLSFEPACDFASKMYYFVMAAAYIFAAYITIGASRNG